MSAEDVLKEEAELTFPYFGLAQIDQLVAAFKEVGGDDFQKVAIQLTLNGREVYFHAGTQTSNENNDWVERKFNVVNTFDHSSLYLKKQWQGHADDFYESYGLSKRDYCIVGGGLPIVVDKTGVVGILVVSGFPDDVDDHKLAVKALKKLKSEL
jgi:uncharacterized protein (UPF0303 family)